MRVLLISCYELGHVPLGVAAPLGALERSGFDVRALDLAVDPLDEAAVAAARLIAVSVPMHTALRLGARLVPRLRALAPTAHVCLFGLYAGLNADALEAMGADSVLGAESTEALVGLARALAAGETPPRRWVWAPEPGRRPPPPAAPRTGRLPTLASYARAVIGGQERVAGYV